MLAARMIGFFFERSISTMRSSDAVTPTVASRTRTTASARSTAISACSATERSSPLTSISQPPVSTGPLRGVGDAVARDARRVLDDGLAASQDSVDQRGLADVGSADDGENRQARRDVAGIVELDVAGEQRQILLVQVELVEVGAHDAGAGRGVIVGQVDHLGRGRGQFRGVGVGRVVPGSGGGAVLGIEVVHPPSLRCGAPRGSYGDPRGAPVHRFVALTRGSARRQRGPRRRRARRCSGGGYPGSPGTTPRPCP